MSGEAEAKTIRATLARLGAAETGLVLTKSVQRAPSPADSAADLPRLAFSTSDLVAIRELGRGGMGVVHLAEQRSLAREVAVKVSSSTNPAVVGALVREARIMGTLEHPNLVPVHALGVDPSGAPMIVMKRIDGVTLRTLLDAADHPSWASLLAGHGDRLRAQIDILVQVSRALAFAHERGVVHRDLKPDNVMIGRFGEVYLLDWGAALRLSERAEEPPAFVGTPGYLAPEMVHGDPKLVDARTDVYLLGGTLYEVLSGRMPHDAATPLLALVEALAGEIPPIPSTAPTELANLVRSAMQPDKQARTPSAEAFREALARFTTSREAELVAADARAARARAEALVRAEGEASANAYRALVEARFGFAAAHRIRPHDADLLAELDASLVGLVEREIALRSPVAARAFLGEVSSPPAELVARLERLESETREQQRAADELAKNRREADLTRMVVPAAIVLGITTLIGMVVGVHEAYEAASTGQGFAVPEAIVTDSVLVAILAASLVAGRRALFSTKASRRIVGMYAVGAVGMAVSDFVTFSLGRGTSEAAAHSLTVLAVLVATVGMTLRRALVAFPVVVGCLLAVIELPRFAPVFALLAIVTSAVVAIVAFRKHAEVAREG